MVHHAEDICSSLVGSQQFQAGGPNISPGTEPVCHTTLALTASRGLALDAY